MLHGSRSPSPEDEVPCPVTYAEEQEKLRKDTITAFHNAVPNGDGDDFLIAREKTKDELQMEEEEYRAFLEKEVGDLKKLINLEDNTHTGVVYGEQSGQEDQGTEKVDTKKKKKKIRDEPDSGTAKLKKTQAEKDQEFLMK